MKKNPSVYLNHILKAIKKIESYKKQIEFKTFVDDDMRHDAIIRQLEIIGEAANHLPKEFLKANPEFPIIKAINMRNFLIHRYDDVDLEVVWETVTQDIPKLKQYIKHAP